MSCRTHGTLRFLRYSAAVSLYPWTYTCVRGMRSPIAKNFSERPEPDKTYPAALSDSKGSHGGKKSGLVSTAYHGTRDFLGVEEGIGVRDIGEPREDIRELRKLTSCNASVPRDMEKVYITGFGKVRFDVDNPPDEQESGWVPNVEPKVGVKPSGETTSAPEHLKVTSSEMVMRHSRNPPREERRESCEDLQEHKHSEVPNLEHRMGVKSSRKTVDVLKQPEEALSKTGKNLSQNPVKSILSISHHQWSQQDGVVPNVGHKVGEHKEGKQICKLSYTDGGIHVNESTPPVKETENLLSLGTRSSEISGQDKRFHSQDHLEKHDVPLASSIETRDLPFIDQQLFGATDMTNKSEIEDASAHSASHTNNKNQQGSEIASTVNTKDLSFFDQQLFDGAAETRTMPYTESNQVRTPLASDVKVEDLSFVDKQLFTAGNLENTEGKFDQEAESFAHHETTSPFETLQESQRTSSSEQEPADLSTNANSTRGSKNANYITATASESSDACYSDPTKSSGVGFRLQAQDLRDDKMFHRSVTRKVSDEQRIETHNSVRQNEFFSPRFQCSESIMDETTTRVYQQERTAHKTTNNADDEGTGNGTSKSLEDDKGESIKTAFDYISKTRQEKLQGLAGEQFDSMGHRTLKELIPDFSQCSLETMAVQLKKSILFENELFLAINKPYGICTQGGDSKKAKEFSVADILAKLATLLNRKAPPQLHIVNRLEKSVTGVLILAKSLEAAKLLKSCFHDGKVECKYFGLTCRIPTPERGVIDIPITPGLLEGRSRMVLNPDVEKYRLHGRALRNAEKAVTEYKLLASANDAALVEIIPKTDVKHQMRVHFGLGLRCPFLGDHKYSHLTSFAPQKLPGTILQRLDIRQPKARNLALHLHLRSVFLPEIQEGKNVFIQAPLPKHFHYSVKKLKLKRN